MSTPPNQINHGFATEPDLTEGLGFLFEAFFAKPLVEQSDTTILCGGFLFTGIERVRVRRDVQCHVGVGNPINVNRSVGIGGGANHNVLVNAEIMEDNGSVLRVNIFLHNGRLFSTLREKCYTIT